jgi:hypothetical protein
MFLTIRRIRSKAWVETHIEHADFWAMKTFTLRQRCANADQPLGHLRFRKQVITLQ